MQLGTRWVAGTTPPPAVPQALHEEIAKVEAVVFRGAAGMPAPRWTLTWLERRPVAELDTGVIVSQDADGSVVVRYDTDDEFN